MENAESLAIFTSLTPPSPPGRCVDSGAGDLAIALKPVLPGLRPIEVLAATVHGHIRRARRSIHRLHRRRSRERTPGRFTG